MNDPLRRDLRRNSVLLGIDYVVFWVAMAFLGPMTILPTLVRLLGGSEVAVGSLGTIMSGGWLLPQLLAGRHVVGRPFVKRQVLAPAYAGRCLFLLLVPALLLLGGRAPQLALVALLVSYLGFTIGDALSTVGWIELMSKTIPAESRGRYLGLMQATGSLLAIGAGAMVSSILARPVPFLANHVFLILIAGILFFVGTTATAMIREPPGVDLGEAQPGWREYAPRLASIIRGDRRFAWLVVVRWLTALSDMGAAFYVLFAIDRLGVAPEMAGVFISVGVAGNLCSGIGLGLLADRRGCSQVIRVIAALRCIAPVLVLVAPLLLRVDRLAALAAIVAVFFAGGLANGGFTVGFTNFLLQIAPPAERSTYVALANTLGGLVTVAPMLAGKLLEATSYEFLFLVVLGMGMLAFVAATREPAPVAARAALGR
ncbi:MAG: MFS transporter [Anaerolineae bacterium]|nr:MFS transporter [Anaerolineae bacterium]